MSDDTVKKIVLTGSAAESMAPSTYDGGGVKRRSSSRRKKGYNSIGPTEITKVGAGMSPGTMDQLSSTRASGPVVAIERPNIIIPALGAAQPIPIGGKPAPVPAPVPVAAPVQKVILAKSSKTKKVFLAPAPVVKNESKVPSKKRKTMKRIHINVGGSQVKRVKTLKNKSSKKTLEEVKSALEKAGLIKSDTKAPENVLRQMYTDFMVLKKRAL